MGTEAVWVVNDEGNIGLADVLCRSGDVLLTVMGPRVLGESAFSDESGAIAYHNNILKAALDGLRSSVRDTQAKALRASFDAMTIRNLVDESARDLHNAISRAEEAVQASAASGVKATMGDSNLDMKVFKLKALLGANASN